jgi:hypothetical protein
LGILDFGKKLLSIDLGQNFKKEFNKSLFPIKIGEMRGSMSEYNNIQFQNLNNDSRPATSQSITMD